MVLVCAPICLNPSDTRLFAFSSQYSVLWQVTSMCIKVLVLMQKQVQANHNLECLLLFLEENTGRVDFSLKNWKLFRSSHAKQVNFTPISINMVENPCLKEVCKVLSASKIAVTQCFYLVGMICSLSESVSYLLTPCFVFMFDCISIEVVWECLFPIPVASWIFYHLDYPINNKL